MPWRAGVSEGNEGHVPMQIHTIGIDWQDGFSWELSPATRADIPILGDGRPSGRSHAPAEAREAAVTAGCSDSRVKQ